MKTCTVIMTQRKDTAAHTQRKQEFVLQKQNFFSAHQCVIHHVSRIPKAESRKSQRFVLIGQMLQCCIQNLKKARNEHCVHRSFQHQSTLCTPLPEPLQDALLSAISEHKTLEDTWTLRLSPTAVPLMTLNTARQNPLKNHLHLSYCHHGVTVAQRERGRLWMPNAAYKPSCPWPRY